MQTAEALERVAQEAVLDLAADGAVYAELRFAPMLHLRRGLEPERVLDAVLAGCAAGRRRSRDPGLRHRLRHAPGATTPRRWPRSAGGFAGRGRGGLRPGGAGGRLPRLAPSRRLPGGGGGGLRLTLHAGEGPGWAASPMPWAAGPSASATGSGWWRTSPCARAGWWAWGRWPPRCTPAASRWRSAPRRTCTPAPSASVEQHPVGVLHRAGFAVTLSPDNRLMSGTSMTAEFALVVEHHGFGIDDLRTVTLRAVEAAFCDPGTRAEVRERVLAGYPGPERRPRPTSGPRPEAGRQGIGRARSPPPPAGLPPRCRRCCGSGRARSRRGVCNRGTHLWWSRLTPPPTMSRSGQKRLST